MYGFQGERFPWTDETASVLTVLLFSLLHVGKIGSHFHNFNNVHNQIQAFKEIWERTKAGNTFFLYNFQMITVNVMNTIFVIHMR